MMTSKQELNLRKSKAIHFRLPMVVCLLWRVRKTTHFLERFYLILSDKSPSPTGMERMTSLHASPRMIQLERHDEIHPSPSPQKAMMALGTSNFLNSVSFFLCKILLRPGLSLESSEKVTIKKTSLCFKLCRDYSAHLRCNIIYYSQLKTTHPKQ